MNNIDKLSIATIRSLAIDTINKFGSFDAFTAEVIPPWDINN